MTARSFDLKYGLLVASVFTIALVGFFVFIEYLQLDLAEFAASGLLVLAIVAGTASFFSPCSFPLLATILARETGTDSASKTSTPRALQFAAALSVGVIVFLLIMGVLIAAGVGPLIRQVTFTSAVGRILRALVGTFLIVLGLIQVKGMRFQAADRIKRPLHRVQARLRRRSPSLGFGFFGFGYVLAGFGWTGPIMAGLAGHALAVSGASFAIAAFLTAALTMSSLMFLLSVTIARAQDSLVGQLRANTEEIKTWGGRILIIVGAWLIVLAIWSDFFVEVLPI